MSFILLLFIEIRGKLEEDNKSSGFPVVKSYLDVKAMGVMQFNVGCSSFLNNRVIFLEM